MTELHARIGATGIEPVYVDYRVGVKNEAARARTPQAFAYQINDVAKEFRAAGFPDTAALTLAIAQMMYESDYMTSNVANVDHNYSGITFIDKPYQHATKGLPKPQSDGGGNYAHFATFGDWAKDFLRILSLNRGGKGKPIETTNPTEYLARLAANGYYGGSNTVYSNGVRSAINKIWTNIDWQNKQDKSFKDRYKGGEGETEFLYKEGSGELATKAENDMFNAEGKLLKFQHWWDDRPMWQKIGYGTLAVIIATQIIKVIKK